MSRAEVQNQPSVEELLVSIRQAIHGDGASPLQQTVKHQAIRKPTTGTPVSGSMSQTRVSLQTKNGAPGSASAGVTRQHTENFLKLRNQLHQMGAGLSTSTTQAGDRQFVKHRNSGSANGFAGILNGDVRLEEALEKLKHAGLGTDPDENHAEAAGELRTSQYEAAEGDYEEDYAPEPDYIEETEEAFSPQTRQAYIEPAVQPQAEIPPVEQPVRHELALPVSPDMEAPLTSEAITAQASAAFNRLADTIVGQATTGERSIDDITRQLLQPMLQSWLDENLPRLVERLVREEIERVARWGGN